MTLTHDEEFAARVAQIRADDAQREADRGLWLSHHPIEHHDRCVRIASRPVCRRCLVLYPVGFTAAIFGLFGLALWPSSLDAWFIWGLCLPATLDFIGEHLGWWRYSARRQVAVTAVMAVAFGRGLAYELDDRWQWLFWGPVLVFCTTWFAATLAQKSEPQLEVEGP